jgi:transglutaminase/protease-like cytokinesis protein 3
MSTTHITDNTPIHAAPLVANTKAEFDAVNKRQLDMQSDDEAVSRAAAASNPIADIRNGVDVAVVEDTKSEAAAEFNATEAAIEAMGKAPVRTEAESKANNSDILAQAHVMFEGTKTPNDTWKDIQAYAASNFTGNERKQLMHAFKVGGATAKAALGEILQHARNS